jgi:hypothetical protein
MHGGFTTSQFVKRVSIFTKIEDNGPIYFVVWEIIFIFAAVNKGT